MVRPIELKVVEKAAADSIKRIGEAAKDKSLSWEEVSRIAGAENVRLMATMEAAEQAVTDFVEGSIDHAIQAGIFMFEQARHSVDPDFIPDLVAGVNTLVSRVRQQAEAGHIIPINYMDQATRKEIFLVESYMRAKLLTEVRTGS